jgi:hypothetical protein
MTKREKTIVFLMVLSLVYGFYVFFLEGPAKSSQVQTASKLDTFNQFITNIAAMTKDGLSEIDEYIIENISAKWTKDPLLSSRAKDDGLIGAGKKIPDIVKDITYNGYLQMGNRHLAIINGTEYETGEELDKGGFTVGKIYPNRVIIILRGGKVKHAIPLEETQ